MPNYFARVELHDAEWPDDHKKLHKLLADVGFTQCVRYTKGGSGKLPTGFYYGTNLSKDRSSVTRKVYNAADSSGFDSEVTVVKSGGSSSRLSKACDK
jgi:hypothetical protein